MARPINAGFTPAQIIQQYDYYRYPIEQLVTAAAMKEQQQEKAIDALDAFDSELGKYKALPGDIANRDNVIKQYNLAKDALSNEDLTGRTGRKAINQFKGLLTGEIIRKLQIYHNSAEAFAADYKQETEKFGKGESIKFTVDRLNDLGNTWNSDKQGTYIGTNRGKYMTFLGHLKEFNPKLLDGSWDPEDFAKRAAVYGDDINKVFTNMYTKSIDPKDIYNAFNNWKSYIKEQNYYDDIKWGVSKSVSAETGFKFYDALVRNDAASILQQDMSKDFTKENSSPDKIKQFALKYGTDEATIRKIFAGDKEAVNDVIMKRLEDVSARTKTNFDSLSDDNKLSILSEAAAEAYLNKQADDVTRIYGNDITEFKIDRWSWENYYKKKALDYDYDKKIKEMEVGGDYTIYTTNRVIEKSDIGKYVADNVNHHYFMVSNRNKLNTLLKKSNPTAADQIEIDRLRESVNTYDFAAGESMLDRTSVSATQKSNLTNFLRDIAPQYTPEFSNQVHENTASLRKLSTDEFKFLQEFMENKRELKTQKEYVKLLEIGEKLTGGSYSNSIYATTLWNESKAANEGSVQEFAVSRDQLNVDAPVVKHFMKSVTTVVDSSGKKYSTASIFNKPYTLTNKGEVSWVNDNGVETTAFIPTAQQAGFAQMRETYYKKAGLQYQPTASQASLNLNEIANDPVLGQAYTSVTGLLESEQYKKYFTDDATDAIIDIPNAGPVDIKIKGYKTGNEYLFEYVDASGRPLLNTTDKSRLFNTKENAATVLQKIYNLYQSPR
jgi:hypothetical protein